MLKTLGNHIRHNLVGYIALFVALGGTTYAATGGNFILGQSNSASSTTALSAGTTGPALKATNTSTGTAGSFNVAAGHAPFTVNSATKVTKLNADKLDGKDATNWKTTELIRSEGPLPLQNTFTSSGGKLLFMFSGSGYRASSNVNPGRIGMDLFLDNNVSGEADAFTNEFDSHKAFVTGYRVLSGISAGSHTIRLEAKFVGGCGTNDDPTTFCTSTDVSDFFQAAVIETPF
jgi:hypothetical protein